MLRPAAVLVTLALAASARAGGLVDDLGPPRAIGRAGTGTVADDGAGALLADPAGLARRDTTRVQVGVAVVDDNIDWRATAGDAPRAHDQAGSTLVPAVAIEGSIGEWIVGAGFMTSSASERAFRAPGRLPVDQYGDLLDYRYAGISGSLRRDTVALAVARRLGDDVAFGISITGSRVELGEARALWADHRAGETIADHPAHDIDVALDATDDLDPGIVAGVLVAPPDTRLELAASIAWTRAAEADGSIAAGTPGDVAVQLASPAASITLREPVTARAGARWVGSRWIAELDGDLWLMPTADATWQIRGVHLVDATGVATDLVRLPSRASARTHGAVRGAIDAELIAGFLWATAGYAYTTAGTDTAHLSPTLGDLGGHTFALGLEASAGGFTISLGWARTWSVARTPSRTVWQYDNPFAGTDGPVPLGRFDGSRDLVGISVDAELGAAR